MSARHAFTGYESANLTQNSKFQLTQLIMSLYPPDSNSTLENLINP